jgi:hypothetical protein
MWIPAAHSDIADATSAQCSPFQLQFAAVPVIGTTDSNCSGSVLCNNGGSLFNVTVTQ